MPYLVNNLQIATRNGRRHVVRAPRRIGGPLCQRSPFLQFQLALTFACWTVGCVVHVTTMDSSRKLDGVPKSDSAQVLLSSSQGVPSSPPSVVSDAGPHRKIKRPPPVTPRSFKRFFTPRSALNGAGNAGSVRTNRQALKELSSTSLNRQGPAFTKAKADKEGSGTLKAPSFELLKTPNRKRKLSFSSIDSPLESSPSRKVHVSKIRGDEKEDPTADTIQLDHVWNELHSTPKTATSRDETPVNPIRRSKVLAGPGELCLRNISGRMNRSILRTTYGSGMACALLIIAFATDVVLKIGEIKPQISTHSHRTCMRV